MSEDDGVIAWAYGLLSGNLSVSALVGTRIYDSIAPQDVTGDYIILQQQAYDEIGTSIAGDIGAGEMLLTVKAVTQSAGYASASAIDKACFRVLNQATGTATGGIILSCVIRSKIRYVEIREGIRYNHKGSIYCVAVSPDA